MKNVLIVEDTDTELFRLRQVLKYEGYHIQEATNAAEAMALVEVEDAPALVLLDLGIRGDDGSEVLKRLFAMPEQRQPSVIVLAEKEQRPQAVRAVQQGAADFLQKPFTNDDLLLSVRGALTGAQPRHAPIPHSSSELLQIIRKDLTNHHYAHARRIFEESADYVGGEAAYFNLLGVLAEAEGKHGSARTFYRKAAVWTGSSALAAKHNLTRLDQIEDKGEATTEIQLGDEHERAAGPKDESRGGLLNRLLGR